MNTLQKRRILKIVKEHAGIVKIVGENTLLTV